jgi:SOS response regulatory protein OraA/RecX
MNFVETKIYEYLQTGEKLPTQIHDEMQRQGFSISEARTALINLWDKGILNVNEKQKAYLVK